MVSKLGLLRLAQKFKLKMWGGGGALKHRASVAVGNMVRIINALRPTCSVVVHSWLETSCDSLTLLYLGLLTRLS